MPTFDNSNTTEGAAQQLLIERSQCPLHQNTTIEILHDDVLLSIFTSYLDQSDEIDAWRTLVHVCQRWRYLVFASPDHLDLRLECTPETHARDMLAIWPAFPIVVTDYSDAIFGVDNIMAALEQRDRVCDITLHYFPVSKMDMFIPAMLEPFPTLESIHLMALEGEMAVVPDSFLGGSAPQLQWLSLCDIPFPALPTLLSSARNLVGLKLSGIPRSGYISPEEMITCLSAMPNLSNLLFQFDSPESFPNRESRPHPPVARCTLPALRKLNFEGANEYFDDFVARIDTPVIHKVRIAFFDREFYDFSQVSQFIGRVDVFKSPNQAHIRLLHGSAADVSVSLRTGTDERARLSLGISRDDQHLQLRCLAQVCSSSLLPFSNVESLAISCAYHTDWDPTTEFFLWLDLLRPFSAVKVLDMDEYSLTPVAHALKDVVDERITEMLPAIRELSIREDLPSRSILKALEEFATSRGLLTRLDHPRRWVAG